MADTVNTQVMQNSEQEYVVHLTGISDATGESNVTKIDRSALTNTAGDAPVAIDIMSARWNIQGFSYIKISWDHSTDDVAMLLSGNGFDDFSDVGGLRDPRSSAVTGASGDVLLTSVGAASGATYDITLRCRVQ
jgi:hypothetical protein